MPFFILNVLTTNGQRYHRYWRLHWPIGQKNVSSSGSPSVDNAAGNSGVETPYWMTFYSTIQLLPYLSERPRAIWIDHNEAPNNNWMMSGMLYGRLQDAGRERSTQKNQKESEAVALFLPDSWYKICLTWYLLYLYLMMCCLQRAPAGLVVTVNDIWGNL